MRWAWIWLRSLVVLHCCRIRVLGFSGNWEMVVMAVIGLAGEIVSVEAIFVLGLKLNARSRKDCP